MGKPTLPSPAMLLVAAFSGHDDALAWARKHAVQTWGPVVAESPSFDFHETGYYAASMGAGLKKVFWAFGQPFDPGQIVDVKLLTNRWEEQYAQMAVHAEQRPLNLDPGYLCLGKLVLASTKDYAHRIYLGQGIYAEVTLGYKHREWQAHQYTFADYQRKDYQEFFSECRAILHRRLRTARRQRSDDHECSGR